MLPFPTVKDQMGLTVFIGIMEGLGIGGTDTLLLYCEHGQWEDGLNQACSRQHL